MTITSPPRSRKVPKVDKPKPMSLRAQLKNFLINGGDSNIFKKNLYELFGHLDLDEKGYFTRGDMAKFLGFEGPIADNIWEYFSQDRSEPDAEVDFLAFKRGLNLLKGNEKLEKGISREIKSSKPNKRPSKVASRATRNPKKR